MSGKINSDQLEYRAVLDQITTQSSTGLGFDSLLPSINSDLTPPLRMRASNPISRIINIDNLTVTNPQHGRKTTIAPIGGTALPAVTTFTVTMDSTGAGNATPSSGSVIALGMSASQFLKIGVALNAAGSLVLTKGTTSSTLAGAGVPSAPSGSYAIGYFYVATDGSNNVSNLDETNVIQYVGAGGSSSASSSAGVTYFYDTFETETVGVIPSTWARYADAAGVTPVDGTGGSPSASFTFLVSASSPLDGSNSAILSKPASNVQGNGISRDFTVQNGYSTGRKNTYSFLINTTDANYVAGYLVAYIYDITNGVLITPSSTSIPQNFNGLWTLSWDSVSTSQSYRVIFHCATTTTTAWTVKVDDVLAGPGTITQGAAISEWQSYTPTLTAGGTTSTNTGRWRRNGSSMDIETYAVFTGTGSAASFRIALPTGYTASTITGNAAAGTGGTATHYNATTVNNRITYLANSTQLGFYTDGAAVASDLQGTALASGHQFGIKVSVVINEFAGSGTVNLGPGASVEYASSTTGTWDAAAVATNTVYGTSGSPISGSLAASRSKVVRFQNPVQAGDLIFLEYLVGGIWIDQAVSTAPYIGFAGVDFGGRISSIAGGTDVTVVFSQFAIAGTTYNSTTGATAWSSGGPGTAWRLRKANPSAPVGFGMAGTDGSSGLVQAGKVPGQTSGAAIASLYVGEKITATLAGTSNASPTVNTFFDDSGTLSLTAGVWQIFSGNCIQMSNPTNASTSNMPLPQLAIRTGSTVIANTFGSSSSATGVTSFGHATVSAVVNISATTVYKQSVLWTPTISTSTNAVGTLATQASTLGAGTGGGYFYAIRIA